VAVVPFVFIRRKSFAFNGEACIALLCNSRAGVEPIPGAGPDRRLTLRVRFLPYGDNAGRP
jgi:hypothetical protein